jgi:uncharacterized membrane protein
MLKAILISLVSIILCFGLMDAIWLGLIADEIYQQEMQGMLRVAYPVWPWLSFYLIYALSITILAVQPSFNNLVMATSQGAKVIPIIAFRAFVLGLAAYGTYNLTNYAILANWSLKISLIDWAWGCFITTCSAIAAAVAVLTFAKQKQPV